jgi:hypothetical protein
MTIQFEFVVTREDPEYGEICTTLDIECTVETSWEEEGKSYFVSILSATDDNGNDVHLYKHEVDEVEDIAIEHITGDR